MKVKIEFEGNQNSSDKVNPVNRRGIDAVSDWKYAIATTTLAGCMVITSVSNWIDQQPIVQHLQQLVANQSTNSSNLADRLVSAMKRKGYQVTTNPDEINIIYLRNGKPSGSPSGGRINEWSDARLVFQYDQSGKPQIIYQSVATVKPGLPRIRSKLAVFVENGQYFSWRVGTHVGIGGSRSPQRALVQAAPIKFRRYQNSRGDISGLALSPIQSGNIGANQHHGYGQKFVDDASWGCLVVPDPSKQEEFVRLAESDRRYKANSNFLFPTTIISVEDL
ncbi:MAG: hypothetical protein KME64_42855 [Scytonematopsis contorta HA4267-MV1]|jgi:hypothetical protein|nr:hypothetical protein [Scytonematopsis contorta HA4267-MV1]